MHIEAMIMFHVEQLIKKNWNHHNFEKLKKKKNNKNKFKGYMDTK